MKKLLWFALGIVLAQGVGATTWYVDPVAGTSAGDGSISAPKQRVTQLTVAAGDEVLTKRGTEHTWGQITCVSGNSAADPTVYGTYGTGKRPLFSANNNVFLCGDADYITYDGLRVKPTLSTAAAFRMDRAQNIMFTDVEFDGTGGGLDGIRVEAISTATPVLDNITILDSYFHDFAQGDGIRSVIGHVSIPVSSTGWTVRRTLFERIGKAPARFTYQNQTFGSVDHIYRSFIFTDNVVKDSLLVTPTTVDDDQCLHFRNVRETVPGNSIIARNKIINCGRLTGDTTEITGYWFEGLKNVIVAENEITGLKAPDKDGGAYFLDSSCHLGTGCSSYSTEYVSENNYFLNNRAYNIRGGRLCVPFTSTQCNNSEGFSITRGARNNYFYGNIVQDALIGFHVTGNADVNYFYNNTTVGNDYGWYVQTNNADTPAGVAQVLQNNLSYGNAVQDYAHSTAFPKANETYNLIGTMSNDTQDATTLTGNPMLVGGTTLKTVEQARPSASSIACNAGTPVASIHFGGKRASHRPTIGALECKRVAVGRW